MSGGGLSITAVERDTGIAKETLRAWERRYGFPRPRRGERGERSYSPDELRSLRQARRLIDAGMRPGQVFALDEGERRRRLGELDADSDPSVRPFVDALLGANPLGLRPLLQQALLEQGLAGFLTGAAAPLGEEVGRLWLAGELDVWQEHLFTSLVSRTLIVAMDGLPPALDRPRVLLATLPGEEHELGLLMAEAILRLEGASCLPLGRRVPVADLAGAARRVAADALVISVSSHSPAATALDGLAQLGACLPAACQLWAGGGGLKDVTSAPEGVTILHDLAGLAELVRRVRAGAGTTLQGITGP